MTVPQQPEPADLRIPTSYAIASEQAAGVGSPTQRDHQELGVIELAFEQTEAASSCGPVETTTGAV